MTTVAFVVNGEPTSAMGRRARAFAERLGSRYDIHLFYRSQRKWRSLFVFTAQLLRLRPRICYVFDMAYSGVAAGVMYRLLGGSRLVIDTGDAITELAKSMGRGRVGLALTRLLEAVALRGADQTVVRGSEHREWLIRRGFDAVVIPDGVEMDLFAPREESELRSRLGLDGMLAVGVVGSCIWNKRLQTCYGWDLVEAVRLLPDLPIKGVIIGDGDGVPVLRERCRRYGIEERILFLGRLPYEELPRYLGVLDVCLSTQTDDLAGRVRTTGKLPLYLASGRYILASRVGEAARVLGDDMLLDYHGMVDADYPARLAERLRRLVADRGMLRRGRDNVRLARERFDYDILAPRLARVVEEPNGANGTHGTNGTPMSYMSHVSHKSHTSALGVVCDYPEEGWPSMDLAAEMLLRELRWQRTLNAERICPPFRRRLSRLPGLSRRGFAFNADRLCNRLWDFPRHLRHRVREFDLFHLCDHSYSQLVHELPADRTGVFCHDLDTFRCLLEPKSERRPRWFRAMARHILRGLEKAAVVFYTTAAVRAAIERHGLLDPTRLVQAPLGAAPEFTAEPLEDEPAAEDGPPFVLHVGSCIDRKRIDVLLDVFAALRARYPELRLFKVGGPWTPAQREQLDRLNLWDAVQTFQNVGRSVLAVLYRTARLVMLPSEAEGFGLPLVEALACGAVVAASDLPVFHEVGGAAVSYFPVGDVPAWTEGISRLLANPAAAPPRSARLARAKQFSWANHARIIADAYGQMLDGAAHDSPTAKETVCACST
jgi:glycosyltransferase involved in cell wall biosynthesis